MKGPTLVPNLEELIKNPAAVDDLPVEMLPSLRGKLAELDTLLLRRWLSANHRAEHPAQGDRRLGIEEAAAKLGVSKDWLYRNASRLPFTIRVGRSLGFSEQGSEKWLRQHEGR